MDSHEDGNSFGFDFFSGGVFWADERDRDFAFSSIGKAVDGRAGSAVRHREADP
jgi:hypothetical protein